MQELCFSTVWSNVFILLTSPWSVNPSTYLLLHICNHLWARPRYVNNSSWKKKGLTQMEDSTCPPNGNPDLRLNASTYSIWSPRVNVQSCHCSALVFAHTTPFIAQNTACSAPGKLLLLCYMSLHGVPACWSRHSKICHYLFKNLYWFKLHTFLQAHSSVHNFCFISTHVFLTIWLSL